MIPFVRNLFVCLFTQVSLCSLGRVQSTHYALLSKAGLELRAILLPLLPSAGNAQFSTDIFWFTVAPASVIILKVQEHIQESM